MAAFQYASRGQAAILMMLNVYSESVSAPHDRQKPAEAV
jgi:hypothetical protein